MPRIVKIIVAAVVILLCVCTMGVLAMRDASTRTEYCNTCHVVQPYYQSWASGDLLAHNHAQAAIPCQRCHPQGLQDVLQENKVSLQQGDAVKITVEKPSKEFCLSCHGDYATLAERTKNLNPNPHATHLGEVECYQCHKMHSASSLMNYCLSCHHMGTYQACGECHENPQGGGSLKSEGSSASGSSSEGSNSSASSGSEG